MIKIILIGCFILFSAEQALAACQNVKTISSSSAGTQVVASIQGGVTVYVKDGSTGGVWIARVIGSCPTAMTDDMGYRLSRDSGDPDDTGHDFIPKWDGYPGQICAILESGSTPVDLCLATW